MTCCHSCWQIFWTHQYNTPSTFLLPDTQWCFAINGPKPINHAHCNQALDCNISNLITTLSYTCSQIGTAGRSAPPVTLHKPWFLSRPVDLRSFPCICFTVTSTGFVSERSLAAVSRLAWPDHLAMAQSCRRILLWADHSAYPSGAKPPIFSIFKELVLAVFTYVSCNLGCNFLLLF